MGVNQGRVDAILSGVFLQSKRDSPRGKLPTTGVKEQVATFPPLFIDPLDRLLLQLVRKVQPPHPIPLGLDVDVSRQHVLHPEMNQLADARPRRREEPHHEIPPLVRLLAEQVLEFQVLLIAEYLIQE